jgi:hypothetical protein
MRTAVLVVVTLILQRALGWPGMPSIAGLVTLPVVWIVAGAMVHHDRRWTQLAILLGLGWDMILEPVIGPGGIAWCAAAIALSALANVIADRSEKAWFVFGAAGTFLVILIRWLVSFPIGIHTPIVWSALLLNVLFTSAWCGFVGWIRAQDITVKWRAYRARKLR